MDAQEFRRLGYQLVDWIADYREGLERLPVMSQVKPGEVRAAFPDHPPLHGGRMDVALAALERDVMPGITHWNHPSFFAYFPSNTSYSSILGDLAASGIGAQGMSWQTSPAATEVEEVVMDWLRQMVGLSPGFTGVIHDTASTATFTALLCAREKVSGYAQDTEGLQSGEAPLVVYASDQGHSSIEKAALLAGFGRSFLRLIPTDEHHAIRMDLLTAAIEKDLDIGLRPCALVAAVGTTGTTAIDPVAAMADLAEKHGLWLHVDAALAGTAMVLPECRWMWEGVERADSLVFNPHKWMGVGFDLSAYYVRDPQHLIRVMSTNPSYLRTAQDGQVSNFRDWHIQLGRRFRALKLWFYLMDVGVEGLQARLRRDLENAQWLKAQVDAAPDWERLAPVPLQTVCLRHRKPGLDEAALATHNLELARRVNDSGKAYLTPSMLKGTQMLRVSIGAEATERRHVEALWEGLRVAAQA
ncbi:MAG: aspartate aminotransferase family protein [Geothrix sp.]|uniref:pyridoxal phosphate-dependent decarboxylase family protein n=1 Tax=Geothrix sp. TaxID=1962974 RepID=UPI0017F1C727|nr:pyridoxal-dependent decarboxylase [Geothrix sp.]NWJ42210.1 aspartate aminotransferase family protein [Geothrix sp.]WIL19827.1 MAG: pyridoxal-dependent decarboxylase [Geothrix sp.]